MSDSTNEHLEEYKDMRSEIRFLQDSAGKIFLSSVVVLVTLLSSTVALIVIILSKDNNNLTQLPPTQLLLPVPFLFLSPPLIIIPFLYVLASLRNEIFRKGAYIRVFHEGENCGPIWETRLAAHRNIENEKKKKLGKGKLGKGKLFINQFKKDKKYLGGEWGNGVPGFYWMFFILSVLFFFVATLDLTSSRPWWLWPISILIIVLEVLSLGLTHGKFNWQVDPKRYDAFCEAWEEIKIIQNNSGS